ncbi:MAG: hypothetical protein IH987_22550 [Planctomycetes bacterium]|nr:hypothetical protein [Planctomycetota bacterium]
MSDRVAGKGIVAIDDERQDALLKMPTRECQTVDMSHGRKDERCYVSPFIVPSACSVERTAMPTALRPGH